MQGASILSPQAQAVQNLLAAMPLADRQAIAAGITPDQANLPLLQTLLALAATASVGPLGPNDCSSEALHTA